jgi:hypothetical protein
MSTKITNSTKRNFTNKAGETICTISFEEATHSWHIISKAEPNFRQPFATAQAAFYFWYSRFDPQTGKLRHFPPENAMGS